uniref:Transaldolase n=1 Tax=candidate division WOR-3 bacterium TaxID=2052148 RepID=A0A7C6EB86_UNCW3
MGIFIDSAIREEVKKLTELGLIIGVTTNPKLLAAHKDPVKEIIKDLCAISPGLVFYQLTKATIKEMEKEAQEFFALAPQKIGFKIPARTEYIALVKKLGKEIPCAITAIFSDYQTYLACEVGAKYLIPYVNRATRLQGNGINLVRRMRAIVDRLDSKAEILAASIKTVDEAVNCILAGAHHLSMPYDLIMSLGNHPLSEQAIEEFNRFIAK